MSEKPVWHTGGGVYDLCEPVYAARGYGKPGFTADPNFKEASFSYRESALSVCILKMNNQQQLIFCIILMCCMRYILLFHRNYRGPIDPSYSDCIGEASAITGITVLDGNYANGGIGSGD